MLLIESQCLISRVILYQVRDIRSSKLRFALQYHP
jgi:hypothetical protein